MHWLCPLTWQQAHPYHTCVRILHQAQDHTRFLIDVEAQAVLFLGHIDDEVGIGVHWEDSVESIALAVGLSGPLGESLRPSQDSPPVTRLGSLETNGLRAVGDGCVADSTNAGG